MNTGLWLKWSWRDLKARWLQVLAIALIIALGTGVFAGLGGQKSWRTASFDLSYNRLNMYDLFVEFSNGGFIEQDALIEQIAAVDGVATVEGRLTIPTLVDASKDGEEILVRGELVGMDLSDDGPHVNGLAVDSADGRSLTEADSGQNVAALEYKFARHYDIRPGDPLRISGDIDLELVGTGHSPRYFFIQPETGAYFAESNFAAVFVPLDTAQQLLDRQGLVNEALILLDEEADVETVKQAIDQTVKERFPAAGFEILTKEEDPIHDMLYRDAEDDQVMWNIIASLFLIGAAMGAFNLSSRMVESQRRQIGILMALGVSPMRIAIRPMLVALEIAILGTIFGLVIGLGIGELFASVVKDVTPLPYYEIAFYVPGFIRAIALGIIIPFIATLIPVWRAVRVEPVDAIQTGYLVAKGGGLSWLIEYIPLPHSSFVQMPVKNVLRSPWRTLLTVFGIAIAVALLTLMLGVVDIFVATLDRADEAYRYEGDNRILVTLNFFYSAEDGIVESVSQMTGEDGSQLVEVVQPSLLLGGTLLGDDPETEVEIDTALELYDMTSSIWRPGLLDGSLVGDSPGIIISQKAAEDLNVVVGDTVTLRHPHRENLFSYQLIESEIPVLGIHDNPLRPFSYMDLSGAALMNLEGLTNQLVLQPAAGASDDAIKKALMGQPGVAAAESIGEFTEMIDELLALIVSLLGIVGIITLFMAFLIAFNTTSISVDERVREIATMFAFGLPVRTATLMQILENVVIGILGTILGVGLGWLTVLWLFSLDMPDLEDFKFILTFSPQTILAAIAVGVLVVGLTPIVSVRKLRRMDIPSTLRVME